MLKKPKNKIKTLLRLLPKHSGRNNQGKVTVRHQGGRHKRFWRQIDHQRWAVAGQVVKIEYDPGRNAEVALLHHLDGRKSYIVAPLGLKIGDRLTVGETGLKTGCVVSLEKIPVGTPIHNVEITPGRGGQIARGAGVAAFLVSKEGPWATVKLPSGELRRLSTACLATLGQVGNVEWKNRIWGKAGRKIHLGIRPTVRGVAQNPDSHPHGGGEGRSGIGMPAPKTPWGKPALGKRTRNKKRYSNTFIIKRRK